MVEMHRAQFAIGDFHPKYRFIIIKPIPTIAAILQQTDKK